MSVMDQRIKDALTRIATEFKNVRTDYNGKAGDLTSLTTTSKTNLVVALNELKTRIDDAVAASGATIDDAATTATDKTWSIDKIKSQIGVGLAQLVNGAPEALDTIAELAAELQNNESAVTAINAALGNRLRVDINTQGLTDVQKLNGCTNLGIGDPDTDFVSVFEAGLI
ncbi:hypothetical protein [Asticcacaulis taihuensis]|uniref:hypothetical protein n=1 Tax=Asticcacaulis taihuensis TaxID=260084 RepID=UPI0026F1432A|nr:hypothetical protein [Asticcacaulis taihuensis]